MSINTHIGRYYDYYKNMIVPHGVMFIVRLDGNCFSDMTDKNFKYPFDEKFYEAMKHSAMTLMKAVPDIIKIHTHSDEMSCLFKKESDWFNRRLEKITSITAAITSVAFSEYSGISSHFDARVLITPTIDDVEKYEGDRLNNAFRGCVNSYSFYKLVEEVGRDRATEYLKGMNIKQRQELLFQRFGINIINIPRWQRKGTFFEWTTKEKDGFNPLKGEKVTAIRRVINVTE